jgi:hypothetical protein
MVSELLGSMRVTGRCGVSLKFGVCSACDERHAVQRNGLMSMHPTAAGERCADPAPVKQTYAGTLAFEVPPSLERCRSFVRDLQATPRTDHGRPPRRPAGHVDRDLDGGVCTVSSSNHSR